MNTAAHTLLWFRPLSPLNYVLPAYLAQQAWVNTQHIPIDILALCKVSAAHVERLQTAPTWLLSSPTAAYCAAKLGKPQTIAVMGKPTQAAWREAGGAEPLQWLVSPTGESMGLLDALQTHPFVAVLRGKQGRNDLIDALRLAGNQLDTVVMYEKTQHPHFVPQLCTALNQSPVALYFSSTDQPMRVLAVAQQAAMLLASPVFVSHGRIATVARKLGFQGIQGAQPTSDAFNCTR